MNDLRKYIQWLQEQDFSPKTIELYRSTVKKFCQNQELNQENLVFFFKKLAQSKEPATCQVYRQGLVSYARFLEIKPIDWKKIKKLIPSRVKKFYTTLNQSELTRLKLARIEKSESLYQRNNLIFDFLFYSGVRIGELVKIKHHDWQDNSLRILGKGNKLRPVFLPPFLSKFLEPQKGGYLFTKSSGEKISGHQIREVLRQRVKLAKINKWISPHTFRRSFATLLNKKGARLTTIQKLLGHSNLETTAGYIHHSWEELYQDYSKLWQPKDHA